MPHWRPSMTHRLALLLRHHLPRFNPRLQFWLAHQEWAQRQQLQCPPSDPPCMHTHLVSPCPAGRASLMPLLTHLCISSLGYIQQPNLMMVPMHQACQAVDQTISILMTLLGSRAWPFTAQQQLVPPPQKLLTGLGALIQAQIEALAIGLLLFALPQPTHGNPVQPRLAMCTMLQKSWGT